MESLSARRHSGAVPGMGAWGVAGSGGGTPAPQPAHGTLSAADIEGAQPGRIKAIRRDPQPPPDPGMQPTRYIRQRSSPQPDTLSIRDIPGATAGHSDWLRPRKQPLNPLIPAYAWMPIREEAAPVPKFVRDTLDVSDIVGSKAELAAQRSSRGLPSTMRTDDIEGSKPGWRPHVLFEQPRDPMRLDLCAPQPSPKERQLSRRLEASTGSGGSNAAGGAGGALNGTGTSSACATSSPYGRSLVGVPQERCQTVACVPPQGGAAGPLPPDHGVVYSVDWQKQRLGAKLAQAEAARQARAVAEAAIASAAAAAAARSGVQAAQAGQGSNGSSGSAGNDAEGPAGLSGMMKSLRTHDRDKTGRVQAAELAAALQRSGLPLSHGEVAQLVRSVQDTHSSVEYRPFVAKLWGKLQQAAPPAAGSPAAAASGGVAAGGGAAPPSAHLPQFVAARQRRLQTHVALALNQQPAMLAAEAAEVAQLPGFLPWRLPNTKPFSKRMFARPEEFAGGGLGFSGGEPQAAEEAALQWRASKNPQHAWAMRRENRPSKQSAAAAADGAGLSSLPPTPPTNKMNASDSQQQQQLLQQAQAHVASSRRPKSAAVMHREEGSPLLAAERAAKAAGRQEVALVQSLA